MTKKIPVGILGATGMVGQRFVTLLASHPWFEIAIVAASERSAGKTYAEAVAGRWAMPVEIPVAVRGLTVLAVERDMEKICSDIALVFSALDLTKEEIRKIEDAYAARGLAVVSNNSAHRSTEDVPMVMPEVNPHHLEMITVQRKRRGWATGCIAVKPNCSLQCYVPLLLAWKHWEPEAMVVATYQALSGAGKTLASWPEMADNVIPFISGEEEKSEQEPLKILGDIKDGAFVLAKKPIITASCIRVPISDGHLAAVHLKLGKPAEKEELIAALRACNPLRGLHLPSAPDPFITYFEEENRPQTRLDRDLAGGMGIAVGRLREDPLLGWRCAALSHNTIRGAAGGAILVAELMKTRGYV